MHHIDATFLSSSYLEVMQNERKGVRNEPGKKGGSRQKYSTNRNSVARTRLGVFARI